MYKRNIKLYAVKYEEYRLRYFRKQLEHQKRRLDYAKKYLSEWDRTDRGAVVNFYQDVVNWLEGNI